MFTKTELNVAGKKYLEKIIDDFGADICEVILKRVVE